ncbi:MULTISPECIES: lantibiotic dehydratase [Actinosynnema]|uniref:lantibiotic dehydratase n=1 Tax=Actinosynnema TaxID=40566 RepID=UPI0020A411A3|nr:lantibiotic dehydratase [Actinosynnema pretiosum]MCP2097815.1 Lantibiotic dehydratase, C terminus [Actinosynnema pretiosum]
MELVRSEDEPGHAVDLVPGWKVWKLAALRSAGLPFDVVRPFAAPEELALPVGPGRDRAIRRASRRAMDAALLDGMLRCALTWQNPGLIDNWAGEYADALADGRRPELSRMDRRATVIAHYAQRYGAKNDTVGFFGPVAWARFGGGPTRTAGSWNLRGQDVSFEVWAVQAVAEAWNTDPALRDYLPVRLDPSVSICGSVAHRPTRGPLALDALSSALTGSLPDTVGGLVRALGRDADRVVEELRDGKVVQVGFRVPLGSKPELALRAQVEHVPDRRARDRMLAVLDDLDGVRAAVSGVATDPVALASELSRAGERLSAAAGAPVNPAPDLAPGGRTPVYLDARRDLDVTIGDDLLAGLAEPLGIVLDSARWLAGQVGEVVEEELRRRYVRLAARRDEVTLADLQLAAADVLDPGGTFTADVEQDFQLRWAEVLPADGEAAGQAVDRARRLADVLFSHSGRLWTAARSSSPDLMLRDLGSGRAGWVLGELHVALNTLESRVFRTQADDPAELVAAVAADVPRGRVVPVYPRSSPAISSRTYPPLALDPPGWYRYWSYGSDDGHPEGVDSTPATALIVTVRDGDLLARSPAHGWEAPVLECFGEFVTALVVNLFRIRSPRPHSPRAGIGDLVVCRESWRLDPAELAPAGSRDVAHDRLRSLVRELGIPRHVFVRTLSEVKPFYVDFQAPTLVTNLVRAARGQDWVDVVEMLPTPDELWLTDPAGRRYTSELRVVAVDSTPPAPASWPR